MQKIDFDPFSPETIEAGPSVYSKLGKQCPLYRYRGKFDFYIDSDPDDIKNKILPEYETWAYRHGTSPKEFVAPYELGIMTEPPLHNEIRHVIQRGFSQRHLARYATEIDRISHELIDKMLADPKGEGDFYELYAMPLPARLMAIMLGAPEENYRQYKDWADEMIYKSLNDPEPGSEFKVAERFAAHFFELIAERRAKLTAAGVDVPTLAHVGTIIPDDFLSRYICDRVEGKPLSDGRVLDLTSAILLGGNETTMNLIGNLLWRLLQVPERWDFLKANRHLVENAIEESLRYDPPVIGMFRTADRETEMQGCPMGKGTKIMYNIAAVNRDPAIFPDPDTFKIDRPLETLRKHISFGGAQHLCLGLQLARMEVRQVFDMLIDRLPDLRLNGEQDRIRGFNFWGRRKLPVAWM